MTRAETKKERREERRENDVTNVVSEKSNGRTVRRPDCHSGLRLLKVEREREVGRTGPETKRGLYGSDCDCMPERRPRGMQ